MEITLTTKLKNISEIIKKKQDILNVWASKAQKKTPIMYLVPKMSLSLHTHKLKVFIKMLKYYQITTSLSLTNF